MNTQEDFRNQLATADSDGNRKWVYPKKPVGKWYKYRSWVSYLLLVLLFSGPFIKINGNPIFMFNIIERKFSILGALFYPQDFYIFGFMMVVGILAIGIFTLVFGRLFCGWVCPQTIFMEMVFRKIEYLIEGDWNKQKALNKADWTPSKIAKKTVKHVIFFFISFLISNIFLAYIIGSDALIEIITTPPAEHWVGFISIMIFSFAFYIVFSRLREQICTSVCPYGRLQGVLLDPHSIVVAYDYNRGENRAKFRKNEDRTSLGKGDCVDCNQCVHVCPTGIDIRNGTQLECIHCTACIDACDSVMDKLSLPGGLIRYTTEHGIATGVEEKFNKRNIYFSGLLIVFTIIMFSLLFFRNDVEITIVRTAGTLFQEQPNGEVSNLYNFNIVNKSNIDYQLELKLESHNGRVQLIGTDKIILPKGEKTDGTFFIYLKQEDLISHRTNLEIGVYHNDEKIEADKINFLSKRK